MHYFTRLKREPQLADQFTAWKPQMGFLVLLPSRIPPTHGDTKIVLPETHTLKSNSGICIKAHSTTDADLFIGEECFFPTHAEYQIVDTDSGFLLYVVEANKILMSRIPPLDVVEFSRRKRGDSDFMPPTLTTDHTPERHVH
jgi:hypothetical protein